MGVLYPNSHSRKKAAKERNHRKFWIYSAPECKEMPQIPRFPEVTNTRNCKHTKQKQRKHRKFRYVHFPNARKHRKHRGFGTSQKPRTAGARNNDCTDAKGTWSVGNAVRTAGNGMSVLRVYVMSAPRTRTTGYNKSNSSNDSNNSNNPY